MFAVRQHSSSARLGAGRWWILCLVVLIAAAKLPAQQERAPLPGRDLPGLTYTNYSIRQIPWSVHVVKLDRNNPAYHLHTLHAAGLAIGLETLTGQLESIPPSMGIPLAAINGDFYQREKAYAGAPRGLQVVDGELLSAPCGAPSFWVDALGQPHATNVASGFELAWPGGQTTPLGLNGERAANSAELYTPAAGRSTHTTGGREIILGRNEGSPWLPLRLGQTYSARVLEIRDRGDTPLAPDRVVLSLGPGAARSLPIVQTGAVLRISTASTPALHGIRTALSGGPVLLRAGKRQKLAPAESEAYEFTSRDERHPRTAIGWNESAFYLVVVDGRQKQLSDGMTLEELTRFLLQLGCTDALNLDGGGSATLWYAGSVRNSPCDRAEREIANCLVVTSNRLPPAKPGSGDARQP